MKRVLLVGEKQNLLNELEIPFRNDGFDVDLALNGEEGEASYRQKPTGVVVTEIFMADQGGFRMIQKLKKDFPNVKIVAISGGHKTKINDTVGEKGLQTAKALGALHAFSDPVDPASLIEIVKKLSE